MAIENPPTYENDEKKAESMAYEDEANRERGERMAYAEKENEDKIVGLKKKLASPDLDIQTKENLEKEIGTLKLSAKAKSNEASEKYGKHPKYEDNEERAKGMAYAEKDDQEAIIKLNSEIAQPDLGNEKIKELTEKINKAQISSEQKGNEAGEEYDAYAKNRQSLQGLGDELPYYKETALHEMEADMAQKILKADNADQMAEIANSMIATQKSVVEDEKYIKKMSPLEWVNYRVDKIQDEKKARFSQKHGIPENVLENAYQENLDRATKILSDKESQILHLTGLIKGEVDSSKNQDFTAVSENAPRLKELELEKANLEKEVETAKLWLKDAISKKEITSTTKEAIAETGSGEKEAIKNLEENPKEVGGESKSISAKGTETKTSSSDSVETKSGKAAKRELPGWLKIFGQMVGGLLLIGWSALFGFLEKQVPGRKGDKK